MISSWKLQHSCNDWKKKKIEVANEVVKISVTLIIFGFRTITTSVGHEAFSHGPHDRETCKEENEDRKERKIEREGEYRSFPVGETQTPATSKTSALTTKPTNQLRESEH